MLKKFFNRGGSSSAQGSDVSPKTDKRAELGDRGERMAEEYLKKKGYRIIERNFRGRYGEVDIIARQGETVVFVEVKTRSGKQFGTPKEAVDPRKAKRIIKASQEYLQSEGSVEDTSMRFDVIGISIENDAPVYEHIEAAFEAE